MSMKLQERLRRKVQRFPAQGGGSIGLNANGKTTSTSYVTDDGYRLANPDGPEAAAQLGLYEAALRGIVGNANEAMPMGPFDCIDNDGEPYQSAALERALKVGRDLLARTLNSTDTGA